MAGGERVTLIEVVADLKHDLAKYVAWRSANLPEGAWTGPVGPELVDALQADILRTWAGAGQTLTAWGVFAARTAGVARPWPAPELERVEQAVAFLASCEDILSQADRAAIAKQRGSIRATQGAIRADLAALHRRLLKDGEPAGDRTFQKVE